MSQWKEYKKTNVTEMMPWTEDLDMRGISVSAVDREVNHSPKRGDMVARDPNNPADKWLVSSEYFWKNYEEAEADNSYYQCGC